MLNYEILGEENEKTIVFIHGLGGNIRNWKYQEELSKEFKLVFIDLQGFGKSPEYKNMSMTSHAQLVKKTIKELKLKKINLVGVSMGGLIVQEIMKTKQPNVQSITLVSTYEQLTKKTKIEFEKRTIKRMEKNDTKGMVERYFYDPTNRDFILTVKRGNYYNKNSYLSSARYASEVDYKENNKKIEIPTLIITGEDDKLIDYKYSKKINKSIKNSKLVLLKECGHLPNIEKHKEFNLELTNFLKML